jgi:hypothetical protein
MLPFCPRKIMVQQVGFTERDTAGKFGIGFDTPRFGA